MEKIPKNKYFLINTLTVNLKIKNELNLNKILIVNLLESFGNIFEIIYESFFNDEKNNFYEIEFYDGMKWVNAQIIKKINHT